MDGLGRDCSGDKFCTISIPFTVECRRIYIIWMCICDTFVKLITKLHADGTKTAQQKSHIHIMSDDDPLVRLFIRSFVRRSRDVSISVVRFVCSCSIPSLGGVVLCFVLVEHYSHIAV